MRFFKKQPELIDGVDEVSIKTNPLMQLVRSLLKGALSLRADAIVFGMPEGSPWDWDKERLKTIEENRQKQTALKAVKIQGVSEDDKWIEQLYPAGTDGPQMIPTWFKIRGEFHPVPGGRMWVRSLPKLLWAYDTLCVAINPVGNDRTELHYIEIEPSRQGTRRFVDVNLAMADDNTIRFEILGVRDEPETVNVEKYV